ncbi:CotH kinase family protein, partial [Gammaproteobacteria bacterium]|nr:CotH kinase family protein [Gammaproteobacteria bacterium]
MPLLIAGAYLTYRALDRFYTFQVRYDSRPISSTLAKTLSYEKDQLLQTLRVKTSLENFFQETSLPRINLFVPESNLAQLESRMPQSGFQYVKGGLLIDGDLKKVKVKYRGDFSYHWGWDKKSIRVKTGKNNLFQGLRAFNLQAPKRDQQLNNFLSLKLAKTLGLLAPHTEIVRLFLNGQDRGVYIFVEQPSETTLRNARLMPGDLYRGEMVGKDSFTFMGNNKKMKLFESLSYWDKVAINNHYDPESVAPLEKLLKLVKGGESAQSQALLSEIMDMEAWGRFSAFETLASTRHTSNSHNWRLYYDPWRGKFYPFAWDPAGWMWIPSTGTSTIAFNIVNSKLHELLFLNSDFLQARNAAFDELFRLGKDSHFLKIVSDTIQIMETEVKTDSFLRPAAAVRVVNAMHGLERRIHDVFRLTHQRWSDDVNLRTKFHYHNSTLDLSVDGFRPVKMIRLMFDKELTTGIEANVKFETPAVVNITDLSQTIEVGSNSITLHASLMPDVIIDYEAGRDKTAEKYNTKSGYYQINFNGLDPNTKLTGLDVDYGQ